MSLCVRDYETSMMLFHTKFINEFYYQLVISFIADVLSVVDHWILLARMVAGTISVLWGNFVKTLRKRFLQMYSKGRLCS
jgi:hypothetical protein